MAAILCNIYYFTFREDSDEAEIAQILRSTSKAFKPENGHAQDDRETNVTEQRLLARAQKQSEESSEEEDGEQNAKKKDKKLVFLSRSVLQKVREKPMTTGT